MLGSFRFWSSRVLYLGVGTLLVTLLTVGMASAVPIDVTLTGGGPTTWDAQNDAQTSCPFFDTRNGFTTVAGGSHDGNIDGFDVGLQSMVNGVTFRDTDGNGRLSGEQLTVGPSRTAGFVVTRKERALQASPTMRSLIRLQNGRDRARVARVRWTSGLGSDGLEEVRGSSDGDTSFELTDRWVVSSDSAVVPDDPPLVFVLWGRNARVRTRNMIHTPGDDCMNIRMRFRMPPHSSRFLLFFTEMTDDDNATAVASAQKFNDPGPGSPLFNGIGPKVRDNILNWNL
jgi:hypothetical protein